MNPFGPWTRLFLLMRLDSEYNSPLGEGQEIKVSITTGDAEALSTLTMLLKHKEENKPDE